MLEERKAAQEAAKVAKASAEANQENINGKKELAKNIAGVVKGLGALVGAATIAVAALNKMTDSLTTQKSGMGQLYKTNRFKPSIASKMGFNRKYR